jgi:AhpD family alkylhydroperoxidase
LPKELLQLMRAIENYVNQDCGFDKKFVELIKCRVSQVNGCGYCYDRHFIEGLAAGEAMNRLYSVVVWDEVPFYSDQEKAALKWADAITLIADNPIPDELYEEVSRFFSQEALSNLTLMINQINGWNRLAKAFGFVAGNFKA